MSIYRALLPVSIVASIVSNFSIVWIASHRLTPTEYASFSVLYSFLQMANVIFFDWLRTSFIRYASVSNDIRNGIIHVYFVLFIGGATAAGLFAYFQEMTVVIGFLFVCSQGLFDLSQASDRVEFQNRRFLIATLCRSFLAVMLVYIALGQMAEFQTAILAVAVSFLLPGIIWIGRQTMMRRPALKTLPWTQFAPIGKFGITLSAANILFYATYYALRTLALQHYPETSVAGALLATDFGQRIFVSMGMAVNLVLLQPSIRAVQSSSDRVVGAVWRKQATIALAAISPVLIFVLFINSRHYQLFVPIELHSSYVTESGIIFFGSFVYAIRIFVIDVAFVLRGKGGSAFFGSLSGFLAVISTYVLLQRIGTDHNLLGVSLTSGAIVSTLVSLFFSKRYTISFWPAYDSIAILVVLALILTASTLIPSGTGLLLEFIYTSLLAITYLAALYILDVAKIRTLGIKTAITPP